jgi:hypothetical protein
VSLRVGLTVLGWTGFIVLSVLVTAHGLGYPEVHWVLAMPQLFEPAASGVSENISQPRAVDLKAEPKNVKSQQAAGRSASPQPQPKVVTGQPTRPARRAPKPSAALQLQWHSNPASLKPFSPETHYLSLPAYVRYVVHERTGRWITYEEATKMVREKTIPVEAAAVNP